MAPSRVHEILVVVMDVMAEATHGGSGRRFWLPEYSNLRLFLSSSVGRVVIQTVSVKIPQSCAFLSVCRYVVRLLGG